MSSAHILYVDHQGHPAPLACSYHATASRRLSSSVDRYPPSTLTEIDSAFCPQCLSFHDVASAASLVNCPRPNCKLCPLCTAVAVVSFEPEESECIYKCGYCSWTSKECDIVVKVSPAGDGTVGREQIVRAAEELGSAVQKKKAAGDEKVEAHFSTMVDAWEKLAKEEVRRQNQGNVVIGARRGLDSDGPSGWSIDTLEDSIRKKREKAKADATATFGGVILQKVPLDGKEKDPELSLENVTKDALTFQSLVTSSTPLSRKDLLPLPIPLRPRKSRRCRAELSEGRPGILVKPKLNPLEGDSSLRTGHGQWWKKDSSAIHVVPRLQVVRFGSDAERKRHAFLLRVTNPTLGIVRLRLAFSDYRGEPEFEGEGHMNRLNNLLVDLITATSVNAKLDDKATVGLKPTELVELDPVKDAFLELGMTQNKDPTEAETWDAMDVLNASKGGNESKETSSTVRSIAKENDTAWFEFVICSSLRDEKNLYFAVPVALEIQVGEGSWESSLVKPLNVEGNDYDYVHFDLVITWPNAV